MNLKEILAGARGNRGTVWTLEGSEDLNANLVRFPPGDGVGEHVNDEVEVLLVGVSGSGVVVAEGEEHAVSAGVLVFVPKGVRRSTRSASEDFAYLSIHRRRGALRIGGERVKEVGRLLPMSRLDADQGGPGSSRRRSRGVRGVRDGIGRARRLSPPQAIEEADVRTSQVRLTEATSVAWRHRERGGHGFSPVLLRSVHQVSGRARMPAMFSRGRRWLRAVLLSPYAGEDTLAALFRCLGGFYERGYGKGLGRCRPRPPSGGRP